VPVDRDYYTRKGGVPFYAFQRERRRGGARRRPGKVSKPSKAETIHCEACGGFVSEADVTEFRGKCSRCGRNPDQTSWIGRPSARMLAGLGVLALFYFGIPWIIRATRRTDTLDT
jgi:hypothetical protein